MTDMIYQQAMESRRLYATSDPYELIDGMDAVLRFTDAFARNGLRGFCTMINRVRYVVINEKQPEEEQRVVAAHEAGHLILHQAELKTGTMKDFDVYHVTNRLERQANFFAADFLIDDDEVMELMHTEDMDFFDTARALMIPAPFFAFKLYSMVNRGYNMRVPVDLNSTFLKGNI